MKSAAAKPLLTRLSQKSTPVRPEGWKTVFELVSEDGGKVSVTTARKLLRDAVKAKTIETKKFPSPLPSGLVRRITNYREIQ